MPWKSSALVLFLQLRGPLRGVEGEGAGKPSITPTCAISSSIYTLIRTKVRREHARLKKLLSNVLAALRSQRAVVLSQPSFCGWSADQQIQRTDPPNV